MAEIDYDFLKSGHTWNEVNHLTFSFPSSTPISLEANICESVFRHPKFSNIFFRRVQRFSRYISRVATNT
jgi:hypothetical protein